MEKSCIWNFKTVEKDKKLPKSWEEFCNMFPIKAGEWDSRVVPFISECRRRSPNIDKSMLPDRATAEAVLSLCQLIQLRNAYNGDWVPDWKNDAEIKYLVQFDAEELYCNAWVGVSVSPLYFKTEELCEEFLHYFRPLIEKLKPLYGIKEGGQK